MRLFWGILQPAGLFFSSGFKGFLVATESNVRHCLASNPPEGLGSLRNDGGCSLQGLFWGVLQPAGLFFSSGFKGFLVASESNVRHCLASNPPEGLGSLRSAAFCGLGSLRNAAFLGHLATCRAFF